MTTSRWGRGRGGRPWRRIRDRILTRDCHQCQRCKRAGFVVLADEVDHIVPEAQGGTDDDANLEAICIDCHKDKTQRESGSYKERQAIGPDGWPAAPLAGGGGCLTSAANSSDTAPQPNFAHPQFTSLTVNA